MQEGVLRLHQSVGHTAGIQDGTVEGSIVSDQHPRLKAEFFQGRPELAECRLVRHIPPGSTVDIGEDKVPARRPNEMEYPVGDPAVLDFYEGNGTGAVALMRGCFKM